MAESSNDDARTVPFTLAQADVRKKTPARAGFVFAVVRGMCSMPWNAAAHRQCVIRMNEAKGEASSDDPTRLKSQIPYKKAPAHGRGSQLTQ
jgi:hypothetical protein